MEPKLPISDLIDTLKSEYFSDNWLANLSSSSEVDPIVANKIIGASTELLRYYILFFLSGEYCFITDRKEVYDVNILDEYLKGVATSFDGLEEPLRYEFEDTFQINILNPIKNIIRPSIDYFERDLAIQFNAEYKKNLVRGDLISRVTSNTYDKEVLSYINAFKRVFKMSALEHFNYHLNEDVIKNLLLMEVEMENITIDRDLQEAALTKLRFLRKKLLYRKELSNTSSNDAELIYAFNQKDDETLMSEGVEIPTSLASWDELINTHYGLHKAFKSKQRKRVREIDKKKEDKYSYKDFHALIKIYKDDTKDYSNTEELLKMFSDKPPIDVQSKLDLYAKSVTHSYLFNNRISLQCENTNLTYDDYVVIYEAIRNHQNSNDICNYFPWLKLAQTISNKIDQLSNDLGNKGKFKQFQTLQYLYVRIIDKQLDETWKWSEFKRFLPIQMPFSECQSDYEITISRNQNENLHKDSTENLEENKKNPFVKLFFFSSFLIPLNYREIQKEKERFTLNKLKYEALDSVYSKLQNVVEDVNESSEKMRKQERRSVEVLAIFAAVALFSMGSIQIFSNETVGNDPHVYYRFIMAFGYSLCLFVLLIWIVTRDNIKEVNLFHWVILILVFISTCVAIGYFVGDPFIDIITKGKTER